MDGRRIFWYFQDMSRTPIPAWQLYGEVTAFPDLLHLEQISDRAEGHDWTIGAHRHSQLHQLVLLTGGGARLTLDGEERSIEPPALVNLPRGTVHGFAFAPGTTGFVLTLPAGNFPELFADGAETSAALARGFTLAASPALAARFAALAAIHAAQAPFRRTALRAEAAALAAQAAQMSQVSGGKSATPDPRIQRLEAMIRAGVTRRIPLSEMAQALALSPRHLGRLCRAQTGKTPQAFAEENKMREASRLLAYSPMSTQQIAYHLGFDDPAYFSRVFRRNFGVSPSAYRSRL